MKKNINKLICFDIQEISKEANFFGYTTKTVTNLDTTLNKILTNAIKHSGDNPAFSLSLEFTNNKILVYIVGDNNTFSFLTKSATAMYTPINVLKTDQLEIDLWKIGKVENHPGGVEDEKISNILSIELKAEQKPLLKKVHNTYWEITKTETIKTGGE